MKKYDIVIIGGGPSGSTFARLVSKYNKYSILIIDQRNLDEDTSFKHTKACGGLLSSHAQHMLAELHLSIPKSILEDPQLFAVRTLDLENDVETLYQRYYFNMNRELFDRWLFSLVPNTVDRFLNTTVSKIEKNDDCITITIKKDGMTEQIETKYLVGADGAKSKVRKSCFLNVPSPKKYISIQEWYPTSMVQPYYYGIFDKEITDYYSWIIPKDKYIILGTAVPYGENALEKFELLKSKMEKYIDTSQLVKREGAFIERTMNLNQLFFGKGNIALIGEATGATSPTSAEGFSYAFKTAMYLADSFKEDNHVLSTYNKKCFKVKISILFKLIKYPGMYNRFIRGLVIKSKISSLNTKEY